jgi:hypothetical protein
MRTLWGFSKLKTIAEEKWGENLHYEGVKYSILCYVYRSCYAYWIYLSTLVLPNNQDCTVASSQSGITHLNHDGSLLPINSLSAGAS